MGASPPNRPASDESGPEADLRTRVAALEEAVADQRDTIERLRTELRRLRSGLADPSSGSESTTSPPSSSAAPSSHRPDDTGPDADGDRSGTSSSLLGGLKRLGSWSGGRSEDWLNYVGIGLFLLGVAFLLRYTVEQGWLGPPVRIGGGLALGTGLLAAGLRLPGRRRLREVLLGGSGATFYATVFAAHHLYGLVSAPAAFGAMTAITVATGLLAIRAEAPTLAIVGILGGLGTPFLLYTEDGSLVGLSLYLCLVLSGACAVFWARGWRSLLYTTVVGGWAAFVLTVGRTVLADPTPPDRWALQAGIAVAWLLLGGTPVLRALVRRGRPDRWPVVPPPRWIRFLLGGARPTYGLVPASSFAAFGCTRILWTAPGWAWPLVAGLGAAGYAVAYAGLHRASLPDYAAAHGLVASVLAAYGLAEVLGGAALLVAWGVEALLLLVLARRRNERTLHRTGHTLFAVVAVVLAVRLLGEAASPPPIVEAEAWSELVVLGLAAAASSLAAAQWLRQGYRGAALVGWLGWTVHELVALPNGHAYISLLWGLTAALLLVAGARTDRRPLQIAGLAVLAAFVGKLVLVDLASLPPLWRIALFLGFGAAFLALSYLLPGLLPAARSPVANE